MPTPDVSSSDSTNTRGSPRGFRLVYVAGERALSELQDTTGGGAGVTLVASPSRPGLEDGDLHRLARWRDADGHMNVSRDGVVVLRTLPPVRPVAFAGLLVRNDGGRFSLGRACIGAGANPHTTLATCRAVAPLPCRRTAGPAVVGSATATTVRSRSAI